MSGLRISIALILACFAFAISGCSHEIPAGRSIDTAADVTLAELELATANLRIIHYLGSDADFHYFRGHEHQFFRLLRSANVPDFPVLDNTDVPPGSFSLFMAIHDGKLTTPTPADLIAAGYVDDIEP